MRDVVYLLVVIAFFGLGWAYIEVCARILSRTGDIDEPLDESDDDSDREPEHSARGARR